MTTPSVPLHVAQVKGNVKGEATVILAPHTLLVGAAGRGKTTTINLIELALSGFATDVNKREATSSEAHLVEYLGTPGEPLHAVATLSDGRSAAFRIERNGDKVKKAAHAPIPGLRVIYPWAEAIGALLTADRAAAFVLRHAGQVVDFDTVIDRLPSISRDLARTVLGTLAEANPGTDVLALLPLAAAHVKARVKDLRAEIKGAKSVLTAQGADAAGMAPPSDADLAALDEEERALIDRGQALTYPRRPEAPTRPAVPTREEALGLYQTALALQERYQQAAQEAAQHGEHVKALEAQAPAQPAPSQHAAIYDALIALLDFYIASAQQSGGALAGRTATETCPLCAGVLALDVVTSARRDGYAAAREATAGAHAAAEAAWRQATHGLTDARAAATRAGQYSQELHRQMAAAAEAYRRAHEALASVPAEDPAEAEAHAAALAAFQAAHAAVEGEATQLREQVRGVRARRTAMIQAQAAWKNAAAARDKVASLEAEEQGLHRLGDHLAEVRQTLTTDLRAGFIKRAQAYLPEGYTLGVTATGDAFGWDRAGHLQLGLSGAERNMVALALCALIAEDEIKAAAAAGETVLPIIVPEERAYDVATLGKMMRALAHVPGQVILTAPTAPKGRTPGGWSVITVGAVDPGEAGA